MAMCSSLIATYPTQGTCPVLQHCSGITTVVQFSFTAAIVSIQRYHRCAADRGSGCIADRNAAVGDVDSEMKSCDPEGRFRNGLGSIRKRPIKARLGAAKSVSKTSSWSAVASEREVVGVAKWSCDISQKFYKRQLLINLLN